MGHFVWGDLMDPQTGMLPADIFCTGCGKTLNADGNHPAELYAGTYNGLCYGCTGQAAYVKEVSPLDGARRVSWPPNCPSYRRDREEDIAYADCTGCGGMGRELHTRPGRQYRASCGPCLERYTSHPLRAWDGDWRRKMWDAGNAAWMRTWSRLAGVPARLSIDGRKAAELREAFRTSMTGEEFRALKKPVQDRYNSLLARHQRKAERLGVGVWEPTPEEKDRFEAVVARRCADLGITGEGKADEPAA